MKIVSCIVALNQPNVCSWRLLVMNIDVQNSQQWKDGWGLYILEDITNLKREDAPVSESWQAIEELPQVTAVSLEAFGTWDLWAATVIALSFKPLMSAHCGKQMN